MTTLPTGGYVQWIAEGPKVPLELLEALEDGNLVFFCGAGISIRAGLPSFRQLVEQISADFPDSQQSVKVQLKAQAWDRAFFALENDFGRNEIRGKVRKALTLQKNPDLLAHDALLKLATTGGRVRLVTTNFDLAFEAVNERIVFDVAPKLPIPKKERWNSLSTCTVG